MTRTDAKTFLRKIRTERREIAILENKIKAKRFELLPGAIRCDIDKVQTSPEDRLSELVAELNNYEEKLKELIARIYRNQTIAIDAIAKIPSSEQRQVMEMYYLANNNPNWDDVAQDVCLSTRQVLRLHGDALLWLNNNIRLRAK